MKRTDLTRNGLAKVRFTETVEYAIDHQVVQGAALPRRHPEYRTGRPNGVDTISAELAAELIAADRAVTA